jgi:hypothetical protein
LFVCAAIIWSYLSQEVTAERPKEGASYIAGGIGGFHMNALGVFAALDMRTNKLVWQQQWSAPCYSGSLATAGGLVFVGRNDGRLTALDSATGMKLWEFQTGAGMNSPASTFEHNGKQYVVAYSAGNQFAGSLRATASGCSRSTLDANPRSDRPLAGNVRAPLALARGGRISHDTGRHSTEMIPVAFHVHCHRTASGSEKGITVWARSTAGSRLVARLFVIQLGERLS